MTTLINLRTYNEGDYVLIDRRTMFGNPFKISASCTREQSVARFTYNFLNRKIHDETFLIEVKKLKDKKLACWCVPELCHGSIYVAYLDGDPEFNRLLRVNKALLPVMINKFIDHIKPTVGLGGHAKLKGEQNGKSKNN